MLDDVVLIVIILLFVRFYIYPIVSDSLKKQPLFETKDGLPQKSEVFEDINNYCRRFIQLQIFSACVYCASTLKEQLDGDNIWSVVRSITNEIYEHGLFMEFLFSYYFGVIYVVCEKTQLNQSSQQIIFLYKWLMSKIYSEELIAKNITNLKISPIDEKLTDEMQIKMSGYNEFISLLGYCFNTNIMGNTGTELLLLPATMTHYCVDNKVNAKDAFSFYSFLLENHKDYLVNRINIC
ncbi:hypothetical protein [Legionella worsleiensis]|uniref:Uncharacterized protein n=1 Tax=Legionella worsleiensis TaxID=45076 RepID=A0A0W1A5P9_9GAMM|nr:hypothetical protein [Legionella worsleiensis]KTD76667.1 hypothetical protein Lwor_1892 [Legionella worsleiensis]STY30406.1 Uncharacterised protein [Legionella worsleiensis]